jgi:adenylate cyclase
MWGGGHSRASEIADRGLALSRHHERRLWYMLLAGTLCGSVPITLATLFTGAFYPNQRVANRGVVVNFVISVAYTILFATHARLAVRKRFRGVREWLSSSRPATDDERATLVALPRRLIVWASFYWAAIFVWGIVPLNILLGFPITPIAILQGISQIGAAWAVGVTAAYLLTERSLRPLVGIAMRDADAPRPSALGVRPRLLMTFGAAVVAPLTALGFQFLGVGRTRVAQINPFVLTTGGLVLAFGFVVMVTAARTLTEPLDEIRAGFRRLQEGDLDVELDVDEPGEVGQLQAGFNKMVEGLRERERMREVFVRLVGKDVAEHALARGTDYGGEVCGVTAMFVDVIGSTPMAQLHSEYEYFAQLNSFFDVVVGVVEGCGGFVNKFEGDGALCVFGAPVEQADHAARALGAARQLRSALDDFASRTGIHAAIGVSTGNVVAGYVGTADRYEFTVVGDAVNEAKRLTEQAKQSESGVLVADATIKAAQGELANWQEAGSAHLRGRAEPTTTYTPGT